MDHTDQVDFAAKIHLGDSLYKVASTMRDGDVSDPIVYPWTNYSLHAATALLSLPRIRDNHSASDIAVETLMRGIAEHPGAAWLIASGRPPFTLKQQQVARSGLQDWEARNAVGAGRLDLLGERAKVNRKKGKKGGNRSHR